MRPSQGFWGTGGGGAFISGERGQMPGFEGNIVFITLVWGR